MKIKMYFLASITIFLFQTNILKSQTTDTTSKSSFNITSDFMSRYIFRGTDYGSGASIQPTLSYLYKDIFEVGSWGSYNVLGTYSETDPYIKFSYKGFSVTFTDYFIYSDTMAHKPNYFCYNNNTNHIFEAAIQYKGPDKFPISILIGSFIYGNDKNWGYNKEKDTSSKNYYSSYIEIGYTLKYKDNSFDLFLGMTPWAGFYGNSGGIVNLGVTGHRDIKITNDYKLPVRASLIFNPESERVYFIFGFTL